MGTLTITTTTPQDQRLFVAYGRKLNTRNGVGAPRNATAAEIKEEIIRMIVQDVLDSERAAAREAAESSVTVFGAVA